MKPTLDRRRFRALFTDRAVILTDLADGTPRDLAARVNESVGRGDAMLRTRAEYDALFDAVAGQAAPSDVRTVARTDGADGHPDGQTDHRGSDGAGPTLVVTDDQGRPTPTGATVQAFVAASTGKQEFFDRPMYQVDITDWPAREMLPEEPVESQGSRLSLWRTDPKDERRIPPAGHSGVLFTTTTFSLVNSGNRTKHSPKRSWKVDFDPGKDDDRLVGMARLNLKSMYNDPSQMREALAWRLFGKAGVPAARHTYAKLGINGKYHGLYSLIEQVDKHFLHDHFPDNHQGNLYKAYCGSIGCATLEHRRGPDGSDDGRQYFTQDHPDDQTYRLKTNEHDAASNTLDDLATFIRAINGVDLPGGNGRFHTDAFRAEVEKVFDVRSFLRWAGVNVLLGSWDNYFATPANYYLYNGGQPGRGDGYLSEPYFTWIPWDYDNSFGIDYVGTSWQYTDLLDWPAITRQYWGRDGHRDHVSKIPLVTNLLSNPDFVRYYLDHLEYLLDHHFNTATICAQMGTPDGDGLWQRVSQAAYLEADGPGATAFTGRQFTNDEVFRAGFAQNELHHGNAGVLGIYHYVRMRHDAARKQLAELRAQYPAGSSGATFPA